MMRRRVLFAVGLIVILAASIIYASSPLSRPQSCGEKIGVASVLKSTAPTIQFDGITKYHLEGNRFPNAITSEADGSVWFGEQDVPGIAHLYPNGTLIEYKWPISYSPSTTSIWGIANWNGRIWATDGLGHQVVSLDTATAAVFSVRTADVTAFPYTLTVGPDDSLWFTELFVSKLARVNRACRLTEYAIPQSFGGTPTQIAFANRTLGYYLDAGNSTTGLGTLLSFDPANFSPRPAYGSFNLRAPSSVALAQDGVWVAQHSSSNLAFYDLYSGRWRLFPTSPIDYQDVTLPYFVAVNGSQVWSNEHYANRLARIDAKSGLLTEYSLSDPPASKITRIDNALTFALAKTKVWFTELTANYVGYLNASFAPGFSLSHEGNLLGTMRPGEQFNLTFSISGESTKPLALGFSNTENYTSRPKEITFQSSLTQTLGVNGERALTVTVAVAKTVPPAEYTLLVTVTDGLITQGSYVEVEITT